MTATDSPALVLIAENRRGATVVLCNEGATTAGVMPGQSLATAQSLCADLRCEHQSHKQEQQHLHNLALWAYRFSSNVSLVPPNALLVELSASLRLFRGLKKLLRRLLGAYQKRGLQLQLGLANTPLAAELLSFQNRPIAPMLDDNMQLCPVAVQTALAELDVKHLPLDGRDIEAMHNMGIYQLGRLQTLPRVELSRRFSPELTRILDKLNGQRDDPRPLFTPAEFFSSQRQFDGGLPLLTQLRFPISALLQELESYLRLRQCLNRELCWRLCYLDGGRETRRIAVSHRQFMLRELTTLTLLHFEQQPAEGSVEQLTLECRQFVPLPAPDADLFAGRYSRGAQQEKFTTVMDKLRLRLGENCYQRLHFVHEHLPEYSGVASDTEAQTNNPPPAPLPTGQRPAWLLNPPEPLTIQHNQPCWKGPLVLIQGPERLDCHWWQQRQVRDYYIARHRDGAVCWIYRDCLNGHWYLHGLFA